MKLRPPNDKLIVELIDEEITTASGLIIAPTLHGDEVHPHSIHKAVVIARGVDTKYIKEGDYILLEHCNTRPFSFRDMEYKLINESNIVGRIEDESTNTTGK